MSKKIYKYSEEKLAYVEVYSNKKQRIYYNFPVFLIGFISCVLIIVLMSTIITSPGKRKLMKEKQALKMDLEFLNSKLTNINNFIHFIIMPPFFNEKYPKF